MRTFFTLFLFLLLLAPVVFALEILQTTDQHGTVGLLDGRPGIPRIASLIEARRAAAGTDNVLTIDCGDLTQGSFAASLEHGVSMVDAINALQYDVWVPGNHDFDYGTTVLSDAVRRFRGNALAANVTIDGLPELKPWAMIRRGGWNIAVIGMIPPYLRQWIAPSQLKGVTEIPMEDALTRIMPDVLAAKPDLIVLAIHLGEFSSGRLNADGKRRSLSALTSRFPRISLVLGGHTHIAVPGKQLYPGSWFVQAPPLGDGLALIRVSRDSDGRIHCASEILSAAEQPESPLALTAVQTIRDRAAALAKVKVARTDEELGPMESPTKRNRLAEILCRAVRTGVHADAAFSSTLSRYRARPGFLTEYQIFLLAPYENFITILSLTPDQLRAVIREQLTLPPSARKSFMCVDGLRYEVDSAGNVIALFGADGKTPLSPDCRIRTAFGSYAVSGAGGRYPVLKRIAESPDTPREELTATVRECLREYLRETHPAVSRDLRRP